MSAYIINDETPFAENCPITIFRDRVAILAVVGDGEPCSGATDTDHALAEEVRSALEDACALRSIREAVRAHDDQLNDGVGDGSPRSPTGDDYNTIFGVLMGGAKPDPVREAAPQMLDLLVTILTPGRISRGVIEEARDLLACLGRTVQIRSSGSNGGRRSTP